jgi:lipid-binding SYLF domain-containing protein
MLQTRRSLLTLVPAALAGVAATARPAYAASARKIDRDVSYALQELYAAFPRARRLSEQAEGVLVFPSIIKAGLIVGAQSGDGALRIAGRTNGYYNITSASFGLQAGVQTFGYALLFMTSSSLKYLQDSDGWSIGSGPSIVVIDKSAAASMDTTTLTQDVYAFPFAGRGLMAGIGIEGSKITHIHPDA